MKLEQEAAIEFYAPQLSKQGEVVASERGDMEYAPKQGMICIFLYTIAPHPRSPQTYLTRT